MIIFTKELSVIIIYYSEEFHLLLFETISRSDDNQKETKSIKEFDKTLQTAKKHELEKRERKESTLIPMISSPFSILRFS